MNITSVSNPQWADNENTQINCLITTAETGPSQLPFTASADDVEEYGRQIYNDCVAGIYGAIAPFVPAPPPPPPPPPTAEQNKNQAILYLQQTDWVNEPDVYNVANTPHLLNRDEFLDYRIQIRQIAVYPVEGNIQWPVKPTEQWSE